MFVILMTTLFYKAVILQGEIWCWSLLELKGLMEVQLYRFLNRPLNCDWLAEYSGQVCYLLSPSTLGALLFGDAIRDSSS